MFLNKKTRHFLSQSLNLLLSFLLITNSLLPSVVLANSPTPTPTPTATPTSTPTPTLQSASGGPTPTTSPSPTVTPTLTPSVTASPSPSVTVSPTPQPTPTPTPIWQKNQDGSLTTIKPVAEGTEYNFQNKVKLTFTKIEKPGTLTIKQIELSPQQQQKTGALSSTAYDITSTIQNGTFEYNLTLPNPQPDKEVKVKHSQDGQNFTEIEQTKKESNTVTIEGLDHFTVFVVTNPTPDNGKSVLINEVLFNSSGNEWVEIYNNTNSPIDITGWYMQDENGFQADFPDIELGSGQLVVADYTSPKLNNDGDQVLLYDDTDTLVDQVNYDNDNSSNNLIVEAQNLGSISQNQSIGRSQNGSQSWQVFSTPTKNLDNSATISDVYVNIDDNACNDAAQHPCFTSIQAAADSLINQGGTVHIAAGQYTLDSIITLDSTHSNISFTGAGDTSQVQGSFVLTNSVNNLNLTNLNIQPSVGSALQINDAQNTTIENCSLIGTDVGVQIINQQNTTLTNNKIQGGTYALDNDSTNSVDATYNWWGHSSGPLNTSWNQDGQGYEIGDPNDSVTIFPWYINNQLTSSATDLLTFVNSPKYVRENNGSDLSAQIETVNKTQQANFYIDGDLGNPITVNSATKDARSGVDWWRLYTPLAAGQHTITGQVMIEDTWYDLNNPATTYSLDTPTASYVFPSSSKNIFRSSDNPVRIRVEDEFEQFKKAKIEANNSTHWVYRADCDLRQAGNYLLCDLDSSSTWSPLSSGTYTATTTTYTQANNRVDNLVSQSFTIDTQKPVVSNVQILNPSTYFNQIIEVQADASDDIGLNTLDFFITEPRQSDGACTGNGTHLVENQLNLSGSTSGTFSTSLDISSIPSGTYCLNVQAEDLSASHSTIQGKIQVQIDTQNPTQPTHLTPADNSYLSSRSFTANWSDSTDDLSGLQNYDIEFRYGGAWHDRNTVTISQRTNTANYDLTWQWRVRSRDNAGNVSDWTSPWTVTQDITDPILTNYQLSDYQLNATENSLVLTGHIQDATSPIDTVKYSIWDSDKTTLYADWTVATAANGSYDSLAESTDHTIDTSGFPEDTFVLGARGWDLAGNKASGGDFYFTIDRTTPESDLTSPQSNSFHNSIITITGTTTDVSSGVDYVQLFYNSGNGWVQITQLENPSDEQSYQYSYNWTPPNEGTYSIKAQGTDNFGNTETTSIINDVTYDTTAPESPPGTPSPTPAPPTNQAVQTWNWFPASDNLSQVDGYWYRVFNGSLDIVPSTFTTTTSVITNLTEGIYNFFIKAQDNAGNTSQETSSDSYTVDQTAPQTTFSSPEEGSLHNQIIEVSGTTTDNNGVDKVTLAAAPYTDGTCDAYADFETLENEDNNTPYDWTYDWTPTEEGSYCLKAYGTDITGNVESSAIIENITYDTTTPQVTWTQPVTDTIISGTQTLLSTQSDSPAGIATVTYSYQRDDGLDTYHQIEQLTSDFEKEVSWDTTDLALDNYNLKVVVTDKAGNSTELTRQVGVAAVISTQSHQTAGFEEIEISWTTDRLTSGRVVYDTTSHPDPDLSDLNYGYAFSTAKKNTDPKTTSHFFTITGLSTGTTYYFRLISSGSPTVVSDEYANQTFSKNFSEPAPASPPGGGGGSTTTTQVLGTQTTTDGNQRLDNLYALADTDLPQDNSRSDDTQTTTDQTQDNSQDQDQGQVLGEQNDQASDSNPINNPGSLTSRYWWLILIALSALGLVYTVFKKPQS